MVPKPGFSWNNNSASESWLLAPRVTITAACIPSKSIHVGREVGAKRDVPASGLILPSCWGRHLIFGTRTSGFKFSLSQVTSDKSLCSRFSTSEMEYLTGLL